VAAFLNARAKAKLARWRSACETSQKDWQNLVGAVGAEAASQAQAAAKRARLQDKRKIFAKAKARALDSAAAAYDAQQAAHEEAKKAKAARDARVLAIKRKLDRTAYWCDCRANAAAGFHEKKCRMWGARRQLTHPGLDYGVTRQDLAWFREEGGRFLLIVSS